MRALIKAAGSQSFLLGLGVAAAAYFLGPQLKETLRPAAVKGAQGILLLGDKTKQVFEQGKERVNDVIFEKSARGGAENVTREEIVSFQERLLQQLREEREASNRILDEMKNSIINLREEVSHLKGGEANLQ